MAKKLGTILIVDDDPDVLLAAQLFLKQHAAKIRTEKNPNAIPAIMGEEAFDVILLDMNFAHDVSSGREGFLWLEKILEIDPEAVVVLITAYGDVEMAVQAIKAGATDFVLKPWQNEKLLATLSAAMTIRESRREVLNLRSRERQLSSDIDRPFKGFVGESAGVKRVFAAIQKVAGTDANVLILGENGTGKELVARDLHRQSHRSNEVFISVDLGALHAGLFESELFGHVKGAFTDAREDRAGRFEIASGGTLFLDEVGNLPYALQGKLLTVLQNREVVRLGSNKSIPFDVRLVSASNMPLRAMAAEKRFRQDLLYRINTVEIQLPPLRERVEDIPLLIDHFLGLYCGKYNKPVKKISAATLKRLEKYDWPGNVRELQHAVERAVIMSEGEALQPQDLFLTTTNGGLEESGRGKLKLEEVEKATIRKAISKHGGNISEAARELGLTRAALYRRLEKYGL
jgi:two-component system response regulator HydG